jgi:superfamily II DNA or RNA helicase
MTATAPIPGDYGAFLERKHMIVRPTGFNPDPDALHPALFPFQRALVAWALRKGRSALFCDTGLGKTLMQLVWANEIPGPVLILAPLAVARQTVREGAKWGIDVTYGRTQSDAHATGITITNYEMLPHFDADAFDGVVLDESSILKSFDGKMRTRLIETFADTPYRLACTATPAPNDIAEMANHAEFLGVMSRVEMLAAFFVHDDEGWRLKGHARDPFYRWLASWGMAVKRPSDLGFDDAGYDLPPLDIQADILPTSYTPVGQLFPTTLKGVGDRAAVRADTIDERCASAADLINTNHDEQWLAWVGLNEEGRNLARRVPGAVLIEGGDSPDVKADALERFAAGEIRVLITKTSIAGFGMNFQRCARMVFVGMGDSYEQYYQAIRRCYRFGQERAVHVRIVLTEPESAVLQNVLRKEREADDMTRRLVEHVAAFEREEIAAGMARMVYAPSEPMRVPAWLENAA